MFMLTCAFFCSAQQKKAGDGDPGKTAWPRVVKTWITLDPVQAKYPGNTQVKPCGKDGPVDGTNACVDLLTRHIISRLYSTKENCESGEGVACLIVWDSQPRYAPIGKPIFEDKTDDGAGIIQINPDESPVEEEYGNPGFMWCDIGCTWVEDSPPAVDGKPTQSHRRKYTTCVDKTRFLMTAEDGSKHCIRLTGTGSSLTSQTR